MRNTISTVAATVIFTIGSHLAVAQTGRSGEVPPTSVTDADRTPQPEGQRLSDLIANNVVTSDGVEIGEVDDVIVENGRIVAAIIDVEERLGLGERSISVPFDKLRREGDKLIVDMTAEHVRALPAFRN